MKEKIKQEAQERKIKAENLLKQYLENLNIDTNDPNFIQTPERIYRMYKEMLYALTDEGKLEINKILSKTFPSISNDMVVFSPIHAVTLCPHHFLPVRLTCHIAYIPKGNQVIGLSKIPRLVELLAKQPILQEDLLVLITDTLYKKTSNSGVYVILQGRHSCMCDRGIRTTARTFNSAIRGSFKNSVTRNEALNLIKTSQEKNEN
jgi:GTP cyclohydrolase IA